MRLLLGELCRQPWHSHNRHRQPSFLLQGSGHAGKPLHRFYELEHRDRAALGQNAGRYHGGPMPLNHRKRLYQGHTPKQPRPPGHQDYGARRHLPKRRRTARVRGARRARSHASPLPRAHGRTGCRDAHARTHGEPARRSRPAAQIELHRARRAGLAELHTAIKPHLPVLRQPLQPHAHILQQRQLVCHRQPLLQGRNHR